ncbi:hypothetical protein OEZ85_008596 [Tetradesmus obliquus]|uniref:mannan endo-1,4-beta-mannosidase n=1 Tax=Tetradesmus obliquus TaxID=3088 RepID=A0ABY8TJM6_TETOB|nr:hypothetical protein OEZ85_008596 [Tetradesmus obliquus]
MEPFAGTNCYYLLEKAIYNDRDIVRNTLRDIQEAGFNVIRMWAFSDGEGQGKLQTRPGVPDPAALAAFDWLMDEVEALGGIKLMLTLTNCLADYGGMQQYVRWAKGEAGPGPNDFGFNERFEFYTNGRAQDIYKEYVAAIINRYKGRACIHSWDICNEPRNRLPNAPSNAIAGWVHEAAGWVKSLDTRHPVTVGSEGFFGPSPPAPVDWQAKNPYGYNEGCNWILESESPNIDFACIHSYADQWRRGDTTQQWLDFNKQWLDCHLEACSKHLGNKPLVLQEYNMPQCPQRTQYYDYVRQTLAAENLLVGALCWMTAAEGYYNDGYTLYASSPEMQPLTSMCAQINRPRPA